MLKLKCLLLAAITGCAAIGSADVIPSRAGVYIGSLSATLSTMSASQTEKLKQNVVMFVAPTGEFFIEGESIEVQGNMNASTYNGIGVITNGEGLMPLHFSPNNSAKGTITLGLVPSGSTDALMIEGKVKFKLVPPAEVK